MSKKSVKFQEMKKALCERERVAREVHRKAIQESTGMARWQAWVDKRNYGEDTRHLLLAYGFARGLPYLACERKCHELNMPSASYIANLANDHGVGTTMEAVKGWLEAQPLAPEVTEPAPVIPMAEPEKPKGLLARLFGRTA